MIGHNEFGYHEVIDRTHLILCMLDDHVASHDVVVGDVELQQQIELISGLLADFYQLVSRKSIERFESDEKPDTI